MKQGVRQEVADLGFALWQLDVNDMAYKNRLITASMYEFAKNELQKTIETLSALCYPVHDEAGVNRGIEADSAAT